MKRKRFSTVKYSDIATAEGCRGAYGSSTTSSTGSSPSWPPSVPPAPWLPSPAPGVCERWGEASKLGEPPRCPPASGSSGPPPPPCVTTGATQPSQSRLAGLREIWERGPPRAPVFSAVVAGGKGEQSRWTRRDRRKDSRGSGTPGACRRRGSSSTNLSPAGRGSARGEGLRDGSQQEAGSSPNVMMFHQNLLPNKLQHGHHSARLVRSSLASIGGGEVGAEHPVGLS